MVESNTSFDASWAYYDLRGVRIPSDPEIITEPIRRAILSGRFEAEEASAIARIVRPGDIVLEIGAGIGFMSTLLSRQRGVARVIAVEANPNLIAYMSRLHAENAVRKVERVNAILGREDGDSATFYLRRDFWMGSMLPGPNPYIDTVEVPTLCLERVLREEAATLIVCDIEGAEAFLFDGVDLSGVDRVFVEVHDHLTGLSGVGRLFATLGAQGFAYDPRASAGSVILFQRIDPDAPHRPYEG